MDFSFYSNILISISAWILTLFLWKKGVRKHFLGFFIVTGISSLFGAYGHLEQNSLASSSGLLFISRLLSIWSMYYFTRATLSMFELYTFKPAKTLNAATPLVMIVFLMVRNSFSPVVIYGVLSMALLGTITYALHYRKYPKLTIPMIIGIVFLISASVVFGFISEIGALKAADISHILVAISLTFMAIGVKNTSLYELEV